MASQGPPASFHGRMGFRPQCQSAETRQGRQVVAHKRVSRATATCLPGLLCSLRSECREQAAATCLPHQLYSTIRCEPNQRAEQVGWGRIAGSSCKKDSLLCRHCLTQASLPLLFLSCPGGTPEGPRGGSLIESNGHLLQPLLLPPLPACLPWQAPLTLDLALYTTLVSNY